MRWLRVLKWPALVLGAVLVTLLAVRVWDSQRGPPLERWHTFAPPELSADELEATDWAGYLAAERAAFEAVRVEVEQKLDPEDRVPVNRFFAGSPVNPQRFARNWNRSFMLQPDRIPVGAVVLLHGLTDGPYSLRHVAQRYRERGWLAVGIRLPGHGTVPGGLTEVDWEDWLAASRLAVREAQRRVGAAPLHLVGYSNGGALAMKYALDALADPELARPDRIVLISPMIGVTAFARFAGLAGLPALLPAFAKAAWLNVLPEFNPFRYNSFPVNAATESYRLTRALQQQIVQRERDGRLADLPPVLTLHSVPDATVSSRAVIDALYARLPANGSELVLFDLNRDTDLGMLIRPAVETELARLLPPPPRRYRTSVVTNAGKGRAEVAEIVTEAGATDERVRPLGLDYPADVYSLSHVALPFPPSDGLYGSDPDPADDFGIHLGALAARGERGALIVDLDWLLRMSSNPFFPYLIGRIEEGIGAATAVAR
jgi:alpha-beta hydrolase superfamily lysophospholipase